MTNGEFPPNYAAGVGQVRLLIPDSDTFDGTVDTDYLFSDDQITALLSLYSDSVRRSAAAAIDIIANDQVLLYKVVRTDDLSVNGAEVADALRKRAQSLREEAKAYDGQELEDSFQIVYPLDSDNFLPEGVPPVWGREWTVGRWR